jgi:hypothetical protein
MKAVSSTLQAVAGAAKNPTFVIGTIGLVGMLITHQMYRYRSAQQSAEDLEHAADLLDANGQNALAAEKRAHARQVRQGMRVSAYFTAGSLLLGGAAIVSILLVEKFRHDALMLERRFGLEMNARELSDLKFQDLKNAIEAAGSKGITTPWTIVQNDTSTPWRVVGSNPMGRAALSWNPTYDGTLGPGRIAFVPGGAATYALAEGVWISLFGRGGQEVVKGAKFKHGAFIHLSSLVQSL